jgi:TonB family protein
MIRFWVKPGGVMASRAFPKIAAVIFLLLASALPALAGRADPAVTWSIGLKDVDQKLRAQQWEAAEKQVGRVAVQVIKEAGAGPRASYSLALISAFRAIAAAGLGREDEADWHWATALNLSPDIANTYLAPYGAAAAGLKTRQVRFTDPGSQDPVDPKVVEEMKRRQDEVQPPKVLRQIRPRFPEGLRRLGMAGKVVVEIIIGEDGVPRHPRVLSGWGGPAMTYVALDSLREWRFEPARLDGKPIKVYYVLTVNFGYRL